MQRSSDPPKIEPAKVDREFVLKKCDYFVSVQLWPLHNTLDPGRWLSNFRSDEMDHAVHLLNAFMYFPDHLVDEIFASAFYSLSALLTRRSDTYAGAQAVWRAFIDQVLITYVTGETPNATDSGHVFARRARQLLRLPQSRISAPEAVLKALVSGRQGPVVFVDDFVGSGEQFIRTWRRPYRIDGVGFVSFADFAAATPTAQVVYTPLFCTEYGSNRLALECPQLTLRPAHLLPSRYSALHADSVVWPDSLRSSAVDFLREASMRAGIPADASEDDWRGFHELGLAIAFGDTVPDATLPIFHWERNGWKRLIARR